ncbi:hypothetical protein PsorP6_017401 [Peronosclerospora sorghi]|uniref:Uncharacterized protein n=1 Tax=Peronosclerospora sorghi TaxID=230839 RepID=A0ACC0WP46_9STRA|nr:hypothetical protein PsorP6_017401 [Peronosclerospora sorghi]
MRGRYENHLKACRQARGLATATGLGITEQDQKKGINTLEKKQESLCIFFKRIYDLFERRYTVTPAFTVEIGFLAGVKAVARAPSRSNEQAEVSTAKEHSEPQDSLPAHVDAGFCSTVPFIVGDTDTEDLPETTSELVEWATHRLEEQAEEGSPPPVADEAFLGEPLGTLVINAANAQEDSVQPATPAEDPPSTPAEASIPETPAVLEQTPVPTTGAKKRRAETPVTATAKKSRRRSTASEASKGLEGLFEKRDNLWMTYLQSKESKEGEERRRQRYVDERRLEMEEKRFELDRLRLESETQRFMLEAEEKKRKECQAFILQLIASGNSKEGAETLIIDVIFSSARREPHLQPGSSATLFRLLNGSNCPEIASLQIAAFSCSYRFEYGTLALSAQGR